MHRGVEGGDRRPRRIDFADAIGIEEMEALASPVIETPLDLTSVKVFR